MLDPYYSRPEVSNSDLSRLKQELFPREMPDPTQAYRFGTLVDAMITEPHRVNFFRRSCDSEVFSKEEFELAEAMRRAFLRDELCEQLMVGVETQRVMVRKRDMRFRNVDFTLDTRCKWDGWRQDLMYGFDIKSTTETTQRGFEEAARYFDYPRQRAWYMDIAGSDYDVLIGISKKNLRIFKIFVKRGDPFYTEGYNDYINLAFRYWLLKQAA